MAKISLQNIRKVYPGGVEVVPKLNLEIADKEFVVLAASMTLRRRTAILRWFSRTTRCIRI